MRKWWTLLLLLSPACTQDARRLGDPSAGNPGAIGLAYRAPTVLELPQSSRPAGKAPRRWRVRSKWKKGRTGDGRVEYSTRLPYRLVFYGWEGGSQPEGARLEVDKRKKLRFEADKKKVGSPGTWGLRDKRLVIRRAEGQGPPKRVWIRVPGATQAERSMSLDTSGLSPENFALRTLDRSRSRSHGIFLPAPGRIAWEQIEVPQRGRLEIDAELLIPPVRTQAKSDGAMVVLSVDGGEGSEELLRTRLVPGKAQQLQADLMPWAGQVVTLSIHTEPGATPDLDYVFLADPVLYTPKEQPKRTLVVFVDTLRQDHLGAYGYARDTSPSIDGLAAQSVVYEQARAPSPWTLPSALAAAYGRAPEDVAGRSHLGEIAGAEGWASCAVMSNNWLTAPDTLGSGWSSVQARRGERASAQVKRAERCLSRYPERDTLLFVHFIDPHFPYMESSDFRGRFAGEPPAGLPQKIRHTHARAAYAAAATAEEKAAVRDHLIDRYDQNILAVDASVERLLTTVGPQAVVALFSDHGEEFWDHGGFEHGHTLYEELVRVPMMIRAPGLSAARVATPVGLMDLVPTLLPLMGISPPELTGLDLLSSPADPGRAIGLGRVLFGESQWGVVKDGKKWVAGPGTQALWDLRADPAESVDRSAEVDLSVWPEHLSAALGRPVERVLRIAGPGTKRHMAGGKSGLRLKHPEAIRGAWTRMDPHGSMADPQLLDGEVSVVSTKGAKAPREVFVLLAEGAGLEGLELTWSYKDVEYQWTVQAGQTGTLFVGPSGARLSIGWTWQPVPESGGLSYTGEVTEEMRALGYME
jgi:arylsulfatase A-like enzyme